jgi:predicted NUDIX family phosphoesterase
MDILYIFKVDPETSLKREHANLLTKKHGRIMQPEVLQQFNLAIHNCVELYKIHFGKKLRIIDTGGKSQEEVSFEVTSDILKLLNDMIKERIGYFDRTLLDDVGEVFLPDIILDRLRQFSYGERAMIESDAGNVQPVPVAVITDRECEHIVVAKKLAAATPEGSPEREKTLIYFGGHIREEDEGNQMGPAGLASVANAALTRELKEELDVDFVGDEKPSFCIWDRSNLRSAKHVAFVYHVKVDRQSLRIVADRKEFAEKEARMMRIDDLRASHPNFERWSEVILKRIVSAQ